MARSVKSLCLVLLCATALSACGSDLVADDSAPAGNPEVVALLPDDIAKSKTLRVMTDPTYPPLESIDGSGRMVGSDVDLMNAVAEEMGVKVEWKRGSFSGIIPGLAAGRFDASIAGMYITEDKFKSVTMVQYAEAFDQMLVPVAHQGPELNSYAALCGMSVTIPQGSTEIPLLKDASRECRAGGEPALDIKQFENANNALLAVTSNRADTALVTNVNADYVVGKLKADVKVHGRLPGVFPMGITVAKESKDLAEAVSAALRELRKSGEYDRIMTKWKLGDSAVDAFPVNPKSAPAG
ncbi:ABC transporter substrate-binding protein (plasmid) [Streptomyces sp. HUAS 31]|uniref:ABC transporter substrate-binding protein n=1 Tax=Streptomyces sp. HUAS 31 TaxID=3020055 RepID=UPI0023062408|nr:ABC transporter substrate-binding protein [Streptomyces sp. HUAS 31]WCE02471.1 ABC transporter substrate-binding protein [Streptomyces sp. HUAS 31]